MFTLRNSWRLWEGLQECREAWLRWTFLEYLVAWGLGVSTQALVLIHPWPQSPVQGAWCFLELSQPHRGSGPGDPIRSWAESDAHGCVLLCGFSQGLSPAVLACDTGQQLFFPSVGSGRWS